MPVEGISLDQFAGQKEPLFSVQPSSLNDVLGALMLPKFITVLHGIERSPMTVIAHTVSLCAVKEGHRAVYLDFGRNYQNKLMKRLCHALNIPLDVIGQISVALFDDLNFFDMTLENIRRMDDIAIIVLDSLTIALNSSTPPSSKNRQRLLFSVLESLRALVNETDSHILLTDYSSVNLLKQESKPHGGNVIQHGVDTILKVTKKEQSDEVTIKVDRTSVVPAPQDAKVRIDSISGIREIEED